MTIVTLRRAAVALAVAVATIVAVVAEPMEPTPAAALAAYEAGRFDEARTMLEALDARGALDGPLLYRLFFCLNTAGDRAKATTVLERARAALEESAAASSIEVPFYLVNAYASLGRRAEAQELARATTARVEAGSLPAPTQPIERFQFAKLYQDQGRHDRASAEYEAALAGFAAEPGSYPANVRWARRYLGELAFSSADFARAEAEYAAIAELGGASASDYGALARARTRLGRYAGAATAWKDAVRSDPANADDPRYAARLAEMATELTALPTGGADGTAWSQLTQDQLEAVLRETTRKVQEERAVVVAASSSDPEARARFERSSAEAKGRFVAAGLEYACRRLPLRETAFREGYAVMIFQPAPWEWPLPESDQK